MINLHGKNILTICGKIHKCTAVLNKVRNVLSRSSLYMLYNSLFTPYVTYCTEV